MRKTSFLIAAGLLAGGFVLPAQAQWHGDDRYGYDGYDYDNGTFRCESRDRRTTRCATRGYRVQMIRQLSDMPCVRGRSWGQDGNGVWVTNGCRALFRFDDRGNEWGWNNGWNNGGGYSQGNDFVRCESRDNRSRTCTMSTGRNGDIRMVRQLSDTPCIEGRNWGQSRNGVWVSGGCRAEFVVTRGGRDRPPGGYGNVRPPGDLGNGRPVGGPISRPGNDSGPPPGVVTGGLGGRDRAPVPRLTETPRGGQTPPPGVISGPERGARVMAPPGQVLAEPRARPVTVAQGNDRPPPGRPAVSEPSPGVFQSIPSEPAPRPAPAGREARATETP